MAQLIVFQGDFGRTVTITIGGAAEDLDQYDSVCLKVWTPGSPDSLILEADCVNLEATKCQYVRAEGELDVAGTYDAEIELTKEGIVESSFPFKLIVQESA